MLLRLPRDQLEKLGVALRQADAKEIGGQLFGEQIAPSDFRITALTVQKRKGTFARFVVDLWQAARDASTFYRRTQCRYTHFNYIGEWHSHPSFAVKPSHLDLHSMRDLVRDSSFKGNFAALMIARLDGEQLQLGAWLFDPSGREVPITLDREA